MKYVLIEATAYRDSEVDTVRVVSDVMDTEDEADAALAELAEEAGEDSAYEKGGNLVEWDGQNGVTTTLVLELPDSLLEAIRHPESQDTRS